MGKISLTKYYVFSDVLVQLAALQPGVSTAADVIANPSLEPLWDDIIGYSPAQTTTASSNANQTATVLDDELLRAARANRADAPLLLWCALVLADHRLEAVVRDVLTNSDGRFIEQHLNRASLPAALVGRPDFTADKAITNLLSDLVQAGITEPDKSGGTIVGVLRFLPTAHAVPGLIQLIEDRANQWSGTAQFTPAVGAGLDFALSLGANRWLGLTRDEFIRAARGAGPITAPSARAAVPSALAELHELIETKRQVVLQGPPGTGKTYLATAYIDWASAGRRGESRLQSLLDNLPVRERTAVRIADEVERLGLTALWDIVQFHPSYEYNDFVRTLAAEPVPGGVTFVAQHRILSLIAAAGVELARRGSTCELVLVLDEVNRGNIPSIFGELLYALEYRGQPVSTAYSVDGDASITIPKSLSIIGTMNTADRSIAVIDYALRRRFVFLTVPASTQPIATHRGYFNKAHQDAALRLFKSVHETLEAASGGVQVGPSYYLPSGSSGDIDAALRELARRFVYEVLPLLGEYVLEGELEHAALSSLAAEYGIDLDDDAQTQVVTLVASLDAGQSTPGSQKAVAAPAGVVPEVESIADGESGA